MGRRRTNPPIPRAKTWFDKGVSGLNDSLDSWEGYAYDVPSGPSAEARSDAAAIHLRRLLMLLKSLGGQR